MEGLDIVCSTMIDPGIICVASGSQYNTLQELIEAAKANPGSVSIGVTSVTASEGLAVKQLETAAGCQFNIVPFEGTSAVMTAVSGNHCDALCLNVGDVKTFVDDGSLKVLATGDTTRSEYYPDVPTYQECGYDVIQSNCRAIGRREGQSGGYAGPGGDHGNRRGHRTVQQYGAVLSGTLGHLSLGIKQSALDFENQKTTQRHREK